MGSIALLASSFQIHDMSLFLDLHLLLPVLHKKMAVNVH